MSEYFEIESEATNTPNVYIVHTNLALAAGEAEDYGTVEAMEEGSAVAQALAAVNALVTLKIVADELVVECDEETPWYMVEAEITAVLKDFFL